MSLDLRAEGISALHPRNRITASYGSVDAPSALVTMAICSVTLMCAVALIAFDPQQRLLLKLYMAISCLWIPSLAMRAVLRSSQFDLLDAMVLHAWLHGPHERDHLSAVGAGGLRLAERHHRELALL